MPKPTEHHIIVMNHASKYQRDHYGVLYQSRNVYATTKSHSPTRLVVWDNTGRPNPYRGHKAGDTVERGTRSQVLTEWFLRAYPLALTAPWFDPHDNPTDQPVTILLSPESSMICADTRYNTGQPDSGQVYAKGTKLGEGDAATLVYPDGSAREIVLHFTNNGHGYATLKENNAHA